MVHSGGTALLLLVGIRLPTAQPVEELLRVQVQLGSDLAELEKLLAVHALQHVDQILHKTVVHGNAVQKHLKGVLVGIGVGGRGLFLRGRGFLRLARVLKKQLKTAKVAAFGEQLLRKHRAVLGGAGADKGGHAHIL